LGIQYTPKEIEEIQALAEQGLTNQQIADKLGRTPAAIRNIRHRNKIKTQTKNTLQTLRTQKQTLMQSTGQLETQLSLLQSRQRQVKQALQLDEQTLNRRLEQALHQLKDRKPELFYTTVEEQVGKLAGEIAVNFLKWIVS